MRLVDEAAEDEADEIRKQISDSREKFIGKTPPLRQPYRLSLLVRHEPALDDWAAEDFRKLDQQSLEAAEQEFREITAGMADPLRLQVLIDSYERLVTYLSERRTADQEIIQRFMKQFGSEGRACDCNRFRAANL